MIEVQDLFMSYGHIKAVDGCSFKVKQGEIVGLVGPNGAGKSTIMKILATQIHPTDGTVIINGHDIFKEPISARRDLGFLPEQAPLYDDMEVREYLDFTAGSRGLKGSQLSKRLKWVCESCGLTSVWCRPISELSKGYRQRVGLAQALIHDPPVLILDEPTSGLDPLQIMEIRRLVRELSKDKAILYSSHILQEIAAITDRAVIINEGKITADGRLDELASKAFPLTRLRLTLSPFDQKVFDKLRARVEPLGATLEASGDSILILCREPERIREEVASFCLNHHLKILEFAYEKQDLEKVFSALLHQSKPENEKEGWK